MINTQIELLLTIVNFGMGSRVLKCGTQLGLSGGTIFLGKGTSRKALLDFLGLNEIRKELVLMGGTTETVAQAMETFKNKFHLEKPGRGIALSLPISGLMTAGGVDFQNENRKREGADSMYKLIYAIVELGKSDDVLEAAEKAGSTGGTVITARGSGIHDQSSKVFGMEIEPQKEIVLIITSSQKAEGIATSIRHALQIDEPGHGVIFIMDVNEAMGLYKDQ